MLMRSSEVIFAWSMATMSMESSRTTNLIVYSIISQRHSNSMEPFPRIHRSKRILTSRLDFGKRRSGCVLIWERLRSIQRPKPSTLPDRFKIVVYNNCSTVLSADGGLIHCRQTDHGPCIVRLDQKFLIGSHNWKLRIITFLPISWDFGINKYASNTVV